MSSPISKSAFIKSEQCLKHFYLYKNHAYLRDNLSKEKQLIFKRGNDVGVFSQQLFPNGIDYIHSVLYVKIRDVKTKIQDE